LAESAFNFRVNGCVFVEDFGDGFEVDLILDVLQHHLIIAQLSNQLSSHLPASLVLVLQGTEPLTACRFTVLELMLVAFDFCLEFLLQITKISCKTLLHSPQCIFERSDLFIFVCALLAGMGLLLLVELYYLLEIIDFGGEFSSFDGD
jgi:hypothetical protein